LLANKCSARVKDIRGQLPLHRAAAVGSVPIIKALLEEGKSPVNATDNDGMTALHHAISEGHGDAAILLLKSGAEPEKRDGEGRLAIALVPDDKVSACACSRASWALLTVKLPHAQVKQYILQTAEREGIELP
jgi:26S proteasome non-ATPase regulatory subunit 10